MIYGEQCSTYRRIKSDYNKHVARKFAAKSQWTKLLTINNEGLDELLVEDYDKCASTTMTRKMNPSNSLALSFRWATEVTNPTD